MSIEQSKAAAASPLTIELGSRVFVLTKPTLPEELTIQEEWTRQCLKGAKTPLQAIMPDLASMPPAMAEMAIKAAVQLTSAAGSGGVVQPDEDTVMAQLFKPEGCRFRFWFMAKKNHPELRLEDLETLITSDNAKEVAIQMYPNVGGVGDDTKS